MSSLAKTFILASMLTRQNVRLVKDGVARRSASAPRIFSKPAAGDRAAGIEQ